MVDPKKLCFVTIGATADFQALILATIQPSFLKALKAAGYTDLRIQYGKGGKSLLDEAFGSTDEGRRLVQGIRIEGFDFKPSGLMGDMVEARGGRDNQDPEGVVISHAGTATPRSFTFDHVSPLAQAPGPSSRPSA